MTLESFLELLEGVRKNGTGFLARCPAHEDDSPSLSVHPGKRWILVTCFAGCTVEEICEKLEIDVQQLAYDYQHPAFRSVRSQAAICDTLLVPSQDPELLDLATYFVDLHSPKPRGLDRVKLIAAVYRRLRGRVLERGNAPTR